ncbi:VHS domain-containing protein [Fomitopsis serialis]|uniref:VHS domain-containing protein n=1 Tax=Fomitopsis serialis TaxID=139415 RepID=UPI0020072FB0|nr:VHS domain-containing protein [Neoantrodia serialis]KAH9923891.1 VHS domain-containing protein [Neoantrodia serialis]
MLSTNYRSSATQTQIIVMRACSPHLTEPNYALHLEVAEYINQKKANTPREAAMMIATLVNNRNPHIAMLALALLETLVQSCGYPFHLQIATKEFLNELVRRFPERPPPFPGPVMTRILDLINDWKEGIASESRWREDLGNIRDMHRLLTFKGYRFRDRPRQPPIASASSLKTADELEAEDREAQEAKLQELIRRGTPRDLAAAQELMKTLAGANPDAKPDYRSQALTELSKLESKVILLNELLENVDTGRGEQFAQGDVYDQVASILTAARPKIQGWISNAETDDPESLNTFLQINDQLNAVLNRYDSYKKGDFTAAANPIPPEVTAASQNDSLIDFDDGPSSAPAQPGQQQPPLDDLASLFGPTAQTHFQTQPQQPMMSGMSGMGAGMHMGSGMGSSMGMGMGAGMGMGSGMGMGMGSRMGMGMGSQSGSSSPMAAPSPSNGFSNGMGIGAGTPPTLNLAAPWQHPPGHAQQPSTPNYFAGAQSIQPQQTHQPIQPQQQQHQTGRYQQQPGTPGSAAPANGAQQGGKDPFADLVGLF